jgi:glucosyl-dolichyl phosphate glucuronosyltransferase
MHVGVVSVLICSYNRAQRLARTLECVAQLNTPAGYSAEVIVVDNNSSDATREAIQEAARHSAIPIHYAFEPRQGKSFALNTGLGLARGDVIALTDDDVCPARDWLDRIVEAFERDDPVFVGGKVLPAWETPPPDKLLTRRAHCIWGPLALTEYGDAPFAYRDDIASQRHPIGANMALRRDALRAIGGWRTDLGKVNNTLIAGEDYEIYFRLRDANLYRGLYDPRVVVVHDVPSRRLRRAYFRRWFFANGQTRAVMFADFFPEVDRGRMRRVFGVPRFLYRELAMQLFAWLRLLTKDPFERFICELQTIRLVGLMWESRRGMQTDAHRARLQLGAPAAE